ncbi:MAG: hypothetical protein EU532_04200 [Promethearchaeota archaeon]|nr:MAG: hypothetical protein EU532_04200 [Candidatus Lokiarchaeota archaeon]
MTTDTEETISSDNYKEIEPKEVNMQYHLYLFFFIVIYFGSFLLPGILYMLYYLVIFQPFVLENPNFLSLFTNLNSLLALLLFPVIMIISYFLHLVFIGIVTKLWWSFTEKMSPTKDGIILRSVPSDTLNYYHIRSFIIKYGKYAFTKGIFPWLSNWFYNFVGSSKIGKGSTIEEEIVADKYIDVGENCYVGVNSAICSHVVEGIFGRIPYFEIKLHDNVTCSAFNIVGPGCDIGENSYLLPLGSTGKHQNTKGGNYYFGLPARKIFTKKVMNYLKISQEDLERDKQLREAQLTNKQKEKNKDDS